ncbi:3-hydroxyacyl-CoA dehydrogenase/enoyl-CoA hydratase/3-hydroxybutyryl-CoA epimerase [Nitrobacteraceae bacterium AZCC 2161]
MTHMPPKLEQFRLEIKGNGLVHLIFDAPGRTMNVFSEAAIVELGAFARWLAASDVRGAVIRSGKDTAFCVGADLGELGVAYEMIMKTPPHARFNTAFDHFFRLSLAIRALETSGKPVAAAIAGLALGGGCELALGAHYRVLSKDPQAALGLPESLVGLLPGGGGTQRLPRLIGIENALPVLLEGARLSGEAALKTGIVDALVSPGDEVAAAESWLLSTTSPRQPWDRPEWTAPSPIDVSTALAPARQKILATTLGHYPAPLAILDCVEFGLVQCFDGAIRSEMAIFSHLIQRAEARNMIQTLFLGKTDYERLSRKGQMPGFVAEVVSAARSIVEEANIGTDALAAVGFTRADLARAAPVRQRAQLGYWVDDEDGDPRRTAALAILRRIGDAVAPWAANRSPDELRIADYAVVRELGYPAYLGGPFIFGMARREMDV